MNKTKVPGGNWDIFDWWFLCFVLKKTRQFSFCQPDWNVWISFSAITHNGEKIKLISCNSGIRQRRVVSHPEKSVVQFSTLFFSNSAASDICKLLWLKKYNGVVQNDVMTFRNRRLHSTGKKRSLNICRFKGFLNHQFTLEGFNANDQDYGERRENLSEAEGRWDSEPKFELTLQMNSFNPPSLSKFKFWGCGRFCASSQTFGAFCWVMVICAHHLLCCCPLGKKRKIGEVQKKWRK